MVSRLVAQPVYLQLQKSPCGPALTLRANNGSHPITTDATTDILMLAKPFAPAIE
jgi:hypothetical protein